MLNFGNNRVTHIYKGTELVDSVRYGKETIFPYNADDLVKYCRLYTDLGYSPKYIRMLQKAGLDLDNLDNDAIEYAMQYQDMLWNNVERKNFVYFPRLKTDYQEDLIWFANLCYYTKSIPLDGFITKKITSTLYMFNTGGLNNILALDLSSSDTSNVTNMNSMFENCSSLTLLDVSNFDTSNVTNMNSMFENCSSLTSLDVSNFDTSNVTSMNRMFYGCSSLTSLDVSNFDTSNVTSMIWIFDPSMLLNCIKCKQDFKDKVFNNAGTYEYISFLNNINWEIVD